MHALIVFESMYGNTRAIADAVASGLSDRYDVRLADPAEAPTTVRGIDLLVVGGPTHAHGVSSGWSRRAAASARKDDEARLDAAATVARGLRTWLRALERAPGTRAVAFDTRLAGPTWRTGSAAHGIARRLRARGFDVVAAESFVVDDAHGPLAAHEAQRARDWAAQLPGDVAATA